MKISYVNGICLKNDAISTAISREIEALQELEGVSVRLYAYACDYSHLPFQKVNDVSDVAFDEYFQCSDLVVFHFGVYSPLFNLLAMTPQRAKRLVVFHNITPKQFLPAESHDLINKSVMQMSNIVWADHVICVSETNLQVLRDANINTPASVLPLSVILPIVPKTTKPSFTDNILRIVFLGRFVMSKGPNELLDALEVLLKQGGQPKIRVDMVGNFLFSDQQLLEKVREQANILNQIYKDNVQIFIRGNITDKEKQQVLDDADLFVLPTYHEGFCVPVLEALASGCQVVIYDNSNTPAISGGLAILVPTGDILQLADAISNTLKKVCSLDWETVGYRAACEDSYQYVQQFSPQQIKQQFVDFITNFTS
ncbi:glycosyltransferase [Moraxellaceae bacterium AER2_44_116]|nr:glycosyltransferase [Moraxellaceae bacterium]TQC98944.1 glycosyltransferase [Moraxellaceae bacterium AER2_44_116]